MENAKNWFGRLWEKMNIQNLSHGPNYQYLPFTKCNANLITFATKNNQTHSITTKWKFWITLLKKNFITCIQAEEKLLNWKKSG